MQSCCSETQTPTGEIQPTGIHPLPGISKTIPDRLESRPAAHRPRPDPVGLRRYLVISAVKSMGEGNRDRIEPKSGSGEKSIDTKGKQLFCLWTGYLSRCAGIS